MTERLDETPGLAVWDEEQSQRWLRQLDYRETPLIPVMDALLEQADLRPGERVLDVGCGAGPTTLEASRRVAPGGHVTGIDISPSMIAAARQRTAGAGIDWLAADVTQHEFEPRKFDVVISRFGVMFFSDPVRAFRNLRVASRDSGRLVMAVWPDRSRSEFFARPLGVLTSTADRLGISMSLAPADQGPFALGDPDRTTSILSRAGWTDVLITRDDRKLYVGGPGASDEEAADATLTLGPIGSVVDQHPAEVRQAVRSDLVKAFRGWRDGIGIGLSGGFLIVSARRDGDSNAAAGQ